MTLYWTKSKNIADWIIAWMTGQDCAHFAFSFIVNGQELVFESNFFGCHTIFFETWMKSSSRKIIHQKEVPLAPGEVVALWSKWVNSYDGDAYDFTGALYTGLMELRQRIFKIPKPKKNAWNVKKAFYCDEIYQLVSGKPGFPKLNEMSNGMDTPHDVWVKLNAH